MIKKILILSLFILFLVSNPSISSINNKIIVKVENKTITSFELKNKINTLLISSNREINQANVNKIKRSALNSLINLKIKEIELSKYNFEIEENLINNYLKSITTNNLDEFKKKIIESGLSLELFKDEIRTELKWQRLIFSIYQKKVNIDDSMIEKELQSIYSNQSNITEFKISEIEILLNEGDNKEKMILEIKNQIKKIGFEQTAQQISISQSAINKGDLGWISSKMLSKKILRVIKPLKVGEYSEAIIGSNSILFLKLSDKRLSSSKKIDKKKYKKELIKLKKKKLFNLYSNSHLSKLKNNTLIEYK